MATHSSVLSWRPAVYGVAQSRTRLKRLSSSSLPVQQVFLEILNTSGHIGHVKVGRVLQRGLEQ